MEPILLTLAAIASSLLLGGMAFFSGVVAPMVFTKLEPAVAGGFIRAVFPWYYLYLVATAAAAALALLPVRGFEAMVALAIAGAGMVARQALMPAINRERDAGNHARFDRLHRLSVWLNGAQLLAAIVLVALIAAG